ncbi:B12-binding domain-containing radical SAM protein [Sporomusa sp. KB1]|jgi:radical SAM superfamily enzyme YgiQ (UPF0313 family)|uniref:B12-binding domain-containing radical SAM protein n=1 Tax=Sporomusa sp. KB1 TaxID=943346 RepID=UPI0011A15B75|nr:cobalamin-dependent protein [Sporomusa sp. KB1]TWH45758.1 radical SAM superfamily enzyme YgiQ (UPF0313 family) [Sporomusa sp. KB1]
MNSTLEILLVNSYAPRQRVVSDTALENSLAILRTYLESKGILAEVIDDQRITSLEKRIPSGCVLLLRAMVKLQLKTYHNKLLGRGLLLAAWPLHAYTLHCRHEYMQARIEQIVKEIKSKNIPLLGLKLWYGDAFKWSCDLATAVRNHCPDTTIIVGGPQVKVYGDLVLHEPCFDLAIMGPGEEILAKLVSLRRQNHSKSKFLDQVQTTFGGTLLKTGGFAGDKAELVQSLASQTIPEYRDADLEDKIHFHTIVDGVGCSWNSCNFCSHTRCTVPFTPRPVADIITEIETMLQRGIAFFRFSSSETTVEHGRNIAEAILARGLTIRYSMFIRAGKPSQEMLTAYRLMIQAGLRAVFMGGETGHDDVNHLVMNKGVTKQDIVGTIATIRLASDAAGLPCRIGLSLIYPCPLPPGVELNEVYNANVALIDATLPDTVIVNPPGPFPETSWYSNPEKYGFTFAEGATAFAQNFMRYEYSIYKPAELWKDMGFALNTMEGKALLNETGKLRAYAASLGIPTDISDEYLMMTEAIGLSSKADLLLFKQRTLIDIMSGSTDYTREIAAAINKASRQIAATNTL